MYLKICMNMLSGLNWTCCTTTFHRHQNWFYINVLLSVFMIFRFACCAPANSVLDGFLASLISGEAEDSSQEMLLHSGRTIAEVVYDETGGNLRHCRLYDLDDKEKMEILRSRHGNDIVQNTDFKTMLDIIIKCRHLEDVSVKDEDVFPSNVSLPASWSLFEGIVPGTKWCGLGDIAKDYEDLGSKADVDICCRAHDHCPLRLKAFRTGYGLINLSIYTKSHCDCDEDFLKCLKQTNSKVADLIGNFYFNVLKIQCLREEHPLKCVVATRNTDAATISEVCHKWEPDLSRTRMKIVTPLFSY